MLLSNTVGTLARPRRGAARHRIPLSPRRPTRRRTYVKVIGAGLPRTATTTQLIALEMLGFPCYHMRDMMTDLTKSVPQWRAALEGNGPWDELFEGKESICDFPGSYF